MTVTFDLDDAWRRLRLLVLDFDGVLTDNTVYVASDGTEQVRCWRGDGIGLSAVRKAGVDVVVLSTETDPVVTVRCDKLGVPCRQGLVDKLATLKEILSERDLDAAEVAYLGNDVNDLDCLEYVGTPAVVADAHPDVLVSAVFVTRARGGRGAVREVCDLICAGRHERHEAL